MTLRTAVLIVLFVSITGCVRHTYYEAQGLGDDIGDCRATTGKEIELDGEIYVSISAYADQRHRMTGVGIDVEIPSDKELRLIGRYLTFKTGKRKKRELMRIRAIANTGAIQPSYERYVLKGATRKYDGNKFSAEYRISAWTDTLYESFVVEWPELELNGKELKIPEISFELRNDRVFTCGETGPGP